ncbi:twin-arginine translocase TatA/TatE family subunit [Arthrobacter sp. NPDC080082]|uniref:twin-arginine translocase TatA/TatE family subunit n=1 Tax=unclassified Arthrobacter TaxID=235627 RepID=UPI00343C5476
MFGIGAEKFFVLLIIGIFVLGPERIPSYAAQLGRLVREVRRMASGAQEQLRQELGDDFDDVKWGALDPRQYDPRRIIREALTENPVPETPTVRAATAVPRPAIERLAAGHAAPFDSEST